MTLYLLAFVLFVTYIFFIHNNILLIKKQLKDFVNVLFCNAFLCLCKAFGVWDNCINCKWCYINKLASGDSRVYNNKDDKPQVLQVFSILTSIQLLISLIVK